MIRSCPKGVSYIVSLCSHWWRGRLEVDLLLGSWADKHVPDLPEAQLVEFERILNQETIDIYNFMSGGAAVPEVRLPWVLGPRQRLSQHESEGIFPYPAYVSLQELDGPVMRALQEYANSSPLGRASPEGYASVKPRMSN